MAKPIRPRPQSASTFLRKLDVLLPRRRIAALARQTEFEQRAARKVTPLAFLLVVVFGYGVEIKRSLSSMRRFFKAITGKSLAPSAFQKRFSERAVAFLRAVFAEATLRKAEHLGRQLRGKLARFRDVSVFDATVVRLHDFLAEKYAACRTNHTKAAAKLHVVQSLRRHVVTRLAITAERVGDRTFMEIGDWMRGHLLLFDLGYYSHKIFGALAANKSFFVTRLKDSANPTIVAVRRGIARGCAAKGKRLWDIDFAQGKPVDLDVRLGKAPDAPIFRLVGSYNVNDDCWHLYVTNLPPRRFSPDEIAQIYRLRWEVELLFKELKSTCRLEELPSAREEVVLVLLYATLIALIAARALAARVEAQDEPGARLLSLRLVSRFLIQQARLLAEALLRGGRMLDSRVDRLTEEISMVCRDPNPSRPSVLRRLSR